MKKIIVSCLIALSMSYSAFAVTQDVSIEGRLDSTGTVVLGNTTGATSITELVGTGNFSLNGVAGSTYTIGASTTTGTITIGGTAQTGAITLGSSSGTQILNLGTGAGLSTVNIANGLVGNQVSIANSANNVAQAINIGAGASAANNTIHIGDGTNTAGITAVTIGSNTNFANTTLIKGGNGVGAITLTPQTTGTVNINGSVTVAAGKTMTAPNYISNVATGTQPYATTSTTVNTNLNADQVDSYHYLPKTYTWTATATNVFTVTDVDVTAASILILSWGNSAATPARYLVKVTPAAGSFVMTFSGNLTNGSSYTMNYLIIK